MMLPSRLPGLGSTSYDSIVTGAALANGVPPSLALALMQRESSGNPNAVSSAGAVGLFQLMPGTATQLGVTDRTDPSQSANGGTRYLKQMYDLTGNWNDALVAYNEGPGAFAANGAYPSSAAYASGILSAAGMDSSTGADLSLLDNGDYSQDGETVAGLSLPLAAGLGVALIALAYVSSR